MKDLSIPVVDLRKPGCDTETGNGVLQFVRKDAPDLVISFPPEASGRIAEGAGIAAGMARAYRNQVDPDYPGKLSQPEVAPVPVMNLRFSHHPLTGAVQVRLTSESRHEWCFDLGSVDLADLSSRLLEAARNGRTRRPT